ncbi:unnamed protein product [Closterium sp. NIES-64]|nr:unnamed protein product [Closterium sp. NIES-64]
MGCCLSSTAVEPSSSSSLHAATSSSLPPHKLVKDPMLTSATKVGPEGSLEAHYKLLGNTLGCGRVASVREAVERATGAVVAVKACSKKVLGARPAYISRVSAALSPTAPMPPITPASANLCFLLLTSLTLAAPSDPYPNVSALPPKNPPRHALPPVRPPSSLCLSPHLFLAISALDRCASPLRAPSDHRDRGPAAAPAPASPPIIRLLATHEDSRHLHIVTDKAQGGDLFMALAARCSFTEADAAHIAWQLLQAVVLCHERREVWEALQCAECCVRALHPSPATRSPRHHHPRALLPQAARQLLQAVALCHARGVTHRDLVSTCLPGGRAGVVMTDSHSTALACEPHALPLPDRAPLVSFPPLLLRACETHHLPSLHTRPLSHPLRPVLVWQKPENILLSDAHSLTIKLVDFGSAALFHPTHAPTIASSTTSTSEAVPGAEGAVVLRDFMGTAFYAAPEVWLHAYGPQADVWSAGAVVAVLLTGPPPSGLTRATVHSNATWQAMQVRDVHGRRCGAADGAAAQWTHSCHHMQVAVQCHVAGHAGVRRAVPTLPSETSPAAQSFLRALLEPDPWQRPTAAHALLHPWLAGTAEGVAAAVAGDTTQPAVAATGASLARASPLVAAPLTALPGVGAEEASAGERVSGAAAEMQEGTGKAGEEDRERSARDEERGERNGEMAARRVGQKEEEMLWKGRAQGGAAAEGRVRGGVQLEGSLRGFRLYAATRKLQRACVALLSLELSESEFRQLVRHLASATSAPGTSLEAVSESGGTVEGQSDDRGEQQQQQQQQQQKQQHPPSAMLSLPALLASLDALGHERLSQQLMGVHSSVMAHSMLAHVLPTGTLQAGAVHSGASAAGSSAAGRESEREGCVRGLIKGGEGEKGGEGGGSVHGGSLHGSRRFVSAIRAREGEQHEGGGSQHGSRRFFGLFGGREQEEASSRAGGSQHGSRRFFTMMPGSGAPSPAAAGAPSPGGSLRGSFRMARRLGLLRTGGEEGEGEEEDMASPGADGDVVGAMGGMGARSAALLALRGPLSPRSPSASTHSDNAGGWARRLNARASAGGAGMTWQSPVGQRKSPLALGVSPQSGGRQQGRGAVGGGASNGATTLPAAASAGVGHADRGGLPGGVGMLSCQRVQSCVDLAAMGGAAGDESSPAARNGGSRGWGRGRAKGGFWGPVKGGVQGGGGMGGMNGKGTSVHGECLYREFLLSECTP